MNIKELKEVLQLMADHQLAEIEIEKEGVKIKLKKTPCGMISVQEPAATLAAQQVAQANVQAQTIQPTAPVAEPVDVNVEIVRSPMVGTFYAAPSPDQPTYVKVGQSISEGHVLCIVEAMKLMNEIKADTGGVIAEILVQNGQTVEYDQPLFKIKKS